VQMLKKGTKLYSILTGTCPRCHENSMYLKKNPYLVSTLFEMHKTCASCGLKYKMEPSFFYGAMYVSYAVCIAFSIKSKSCFEAYGPINTPRDPKPLSTYRFLYLGCCPTNGRRSVTVGRIPAT